MTTTLETTIDYYKDLLLYQYINLTKARQVIGLLVSQALVDLLPVELAAAFDIETAVGPQLNILGEYIGFDRYVADVSRDYFTMDDYVTPVTVPLGFTDYTKPNQNAAVTTYSYFNYNNDTALEDAEYRILLKLKLAMNHSNFSLYEIVQFLYAAFGTDITVGDGCDMSLYYFTTTNFGRIALIAYNEGLLPAPMAVGINGIFTMTDPALLWGYSSYLIDNALTVGWSSYSAWAAGEMIDYTSDLLA